MSSWPARLLERVDPAWRLTFPAHFSDREFHKSLVAVTLLYTAVFALFAMGRLGTPSEPLGQLAGPPSISVEIVDVPELDAQTKAAQGAAEPPPPPPPEQPSLEATPAPRPAPPTPQAEALPPPPDLKPTDVAATKPPEIAPEPAELPEPGPRPEPPPPSESKRVEHPPKTSPIDRYIDKLDLAQNPYAAAVDANLEQFRQRQDPRRPAAQQSPPTISASLRTKGAAKTGRTDDYSRSVIAALLRTKPAPFAIRGRVLISFEIGPTGALKFVRVLHSSGNTAMDEHALSAVRRARFDAPPAGTSSRDLAYIIDYIFD